MNKPTELQFEELFGGEKEPEQEEEDENSPENEANGEHEYVELHKLDAQGRIKERKSKAVKDEANGDEKINRIVTPPNGKRKLTLDDFQLLKLVGKGGYGKVYQVREKESGEIYAMKVMRKSYLIKTGCVEGTKIERDVLRLVRHPFIVSLHYAFQTKGKVYLVMDYLPGGQLFFHLRNESSFSEELVQFYAAEVVLALEHLHSMNILHRDLKPENLLLDAEGHICLTDFGLAKDNLKSGERTKTYCGTLEYMSPEMIEGVPYGREADWWGLGILIYDMLAGVTPFKSRNSGELRKKIKTAKLRLPRYLSKHAASLIKGLLNKDPAKRLGSKNGAKELKAHPFFSGLSWRKLMKREVTPPFRPQLTKGVEDVSNFDKKYTSVRPIDSPVNSNDAITLSQENMFLGFSYVRSQSPANE